MVMEPMNMQEPGSIIGELDGNDGGSLCLTSWSRTLLMQKLDRSGTVTRVTGSNTVPSPPPLDLLPGAPPIATNSAPLVLGCVAQPGMTGIVGLSSTGLAASIGTSSQFLLLQNMFDTSTETDADFDLDIKDQVQLECSKFGAVKHIYVDNAGHVYLRMDDLSAASGAQRALHGRCFAGRMIAVTFITAEEYETKVPDRILDRSPCIGFLPKQLTV